MFKRIKLKKNIDITKKDFDYLYSANKIHKIEKELGFNQIHIVYTEFEGDKFFDLFQWFAFREGIIKNKYNRKLCKINFLTK